MAASTPRPWPFSSGPKVPKTVRLRNQLSGMRSKREWMKDPLAKPRANMALRKEIAYEAWGGIQDLGWWLRSPFLRGAAAERHQAKKTQQVGAPAKKRAAKKHEQFKAQRGQQPAPAAATTAPASQTAAPVTRIATPSSAGSSEVSDEVQQLVRAATALGEVDIEHADQFDEIVTAMDKAMRLVGDAFEQLAESCDQLKIHPKVTKPLHDAASDVADISERYDAARRAFRVVYEPYLDPPDKMPDLRFFEDSDSAA